MRNATINTQIAQLLLVILLTLLGAVHRACAGRFNEPGHGDAFIFEPHDPDYQNILNRILARAESLPKCRRAIVGRAVEELRAPIRGSEAKDRYGAAWYAWWCSEFCSYVLAESNMAELDRETHSNSEQRAALDKAASTGGFVRYFSEHGRGYALHGPQAAENKARVTAGDYLAVKMRHASGLGHSLIVIYVDPQHRYILCAEGNSGLNNRVALVQRRLLDQDGTLNDDFYFLGQPRLKLAAAPQ